MKLIGITGGIGSGKTTICKIFSALGVPVFNADDTAIWLAENDPKVMFAIKQLLGEQAYIDNTYNRKWVGSQVFNNSLLLGNLNAIIHPAVKESFEIWAAKQNAPYVLKEAALIVESNGYKDLNALILVLAKQELRVKRVMERNGISKKAVLERINTQFDDNLKLPFSKYVINNNEFDAVLSQVISLHNAILEGV